MRNIELILLLVLPLTTLPAYVFATSSSTGIMIPLYVFLSDTTAKEWDELIWAKGNHTAVPMIAIITSPASGPEDPALCLDPNNFTNNKIGNGTQRLKNVGIKPIGYVDTNFANRNITIVKNEIDAWQTCQPLIEGIFFDQMRHVDTTAVSYYSNLTNHTKSKPGFDFTVGNPGTDTLPDYIPTVDNIVIHETSSMPTLQNLDGWHADYDKSKFSYLVHTQTITPDWTFVSNSANHVVYLYITEDAGPPPSIINPWDVISKYLQSQTNYILAQTLNVPSVGINVTSKDLSNNPITPFNRNVEITANSVKVRNDTSPLFYNATKNKLYTITVSNFGNFTFHHWEDNSTNPTRTVTPIQTTNYTAFYNNTSAPAPYVVDLLDVYASNSTTLGSGTSVCLDVNLKAASSCATALNAGSTYRFEVEVDNTGEQALSPTTLEFRDVVASGDVLGSIPIGNILNSGCSNNTNWSESIVTDDARATSGTTCSIGAGGSVEFWMVVTLDTDANDGTGTFFISDGTVTDTSTTTTFTINSPANYVVDLLDVYQSSSTTLGSGTSVCLDVNLKAASSCGTALINGSTYRFEVEVDNTGEQVGRPTTFDIDSAIGTGDTLGSILVGNILNSGCSNSTNSYTDWSESIIGGTDARASSGTICSIGVGGLAEYWMVITLDADANDDTSTFTIADGTVTDTSTTTSFIVDSPDWYNSNWTYAKKITVDQIVIDSDLASFPLLVNITDTDLGSKAQIDCDDILFTNSINTTKLNHEIENCNMTNDWLTAWVQVNLSGTTDTVIYMYYGNTGATNQENVEATWKSSYQLVAHLHDDFLDSTSGNNDGTNSGSTNYPNEYIADSQSFDGIANSIRFGTDMADSSTGTISVWVRPTDTVNNHYITTSASDDLAIVLGYDPNDNYFDIYDDEIYPCTQGDMKMPTTDDAWQLVAYSYSDTPDDVHGFKNGVLVVSDLNCSIEGEKTFLQLGSFHLGLIDFFAGQIDEFRFATDFYSNDDWFKARYNCELGGGGCITVGAEGTKPGAT